jgi:hypothetical protein
VADCPTHGDQVTLHAKARVSQCEDPFFVLTVMFHDHGT